MGQGIYLIPHQVCIRKTIETAVQVRH